MAAGSSEHGSEKTEVGSQNRSDTPFNHSTLRAPVAAPAGPSQQFRRCMREFWSSRRGRRPFIDPIRAVAYHNPGGIQKNFEKFRNSFKPTEIAGSFREDGAAFGRASRPVESPPPPPFRDASPLEPALGHGARRAATHGPNNWISILLQMSQNFEVFHGTSERGSQPVASTSVACLPRRTGQ